MASKAASLPIISLVILILLAYNLSLTAKARPLQAANGTSTSNARQSEATVVEGSITPSSSEEHPGKLVATEDVRPTNPGHSPGVGN